MRIVKSLLPALLIASLLSSLSYATTPDRISGAMTSGPTVTLRGNVHRKALPQFDQNILPQRESGIVRRARNLKVAGRRDRLALRPRRRALDRGLFSTRRCPLVRIASSEHLPWRTSLEARPPRLRPDIYTRQCAHLRSTVQ